MERGFGVERLRNSMARRGVDANKAYKNCVKADGLGAYRDSDAPKFYLTTLPRADSATAKTSVPLAALDSAFADFADGDEDEDDVFWTI